MREIHYSEIATFLRCRRQWIYRYQRGLVPRMQMERLSIGTAGHKAIECILRGMSGVDSKIEAIKYLEAEVKKQGVMATMTHTEAIEKAAEIADAAVDAVRALGPVKPVLLDGEPLVEKTVFAQISLGIVVRGTADEVLEFADGVRLVVDNKFRASFTTHSTEALNLQMGMYQALLMRNSVPTHGSMQLQINRNPPRIPRQNQDGSISRAVIASTWEVYSDEVIRAGRNPCDYLDMKPKLKYKAFDMSVRAYRSRIELENLWETTIDPLAREIADAYSEPDRGQGRCFTREVCSSCEMKELCIEELKSGDSQLVQISQYQHKDDPVAAPPAFELVEDYDD